MRQVMSALASIPAANVASRPWGANMRTRCSTRGVSANLWRHDGQTMRCLHQGENTIHLFLLSLGIGISSRLVIQGREIDHRGGGIRMVRSQACSPNLERLDE